MEHNVSEKLHRINNLLAETDAVYHQASLRLGIADSTMRILYTILDNGERCLLSDVYKQSGISKQDCEFSPAQAGERQHGIPGESQGKGQNRMPDRCGQSSGPTNGSPAI